MLTQLKLNDLITLSMKYSLETVAAYSDICSDLSDPNCNHVLEIPIV